jgi:hypothetical protein
MSNDQSVNQQLRSVLVRAYKNEAKLGALMRELKRIIYTTNEKYYLRGNFMGRYLGKEVTMFTKATDDETGATCLQGSIDIPYATLVKVFGQPEGQTDDYKVDAEWDLKFQGVPFTIYNYKDGVNYNGSSGLPVEEIRNWHIGGHSVAAVHAVKFILAQAGELNQESLYPHLREKASH